MGRTPFNIKNMLTNPHEGREQNICAHCNVITFAQYHYATKSSILNLHIHYVSQSLSLLAKALIGQFIFLTDQGPDLNYVSVPSPIQPIHLQSGQTQITTKNN